MIEGSEVLKLRKKLGEILLESGLLSDILLQQALQSSLSSGKRLGEVLVAQGLITEQGLARCLSDQLGFRFVDLQSETPDRSVATCVPESLAKRLQIVPFQVEGKTLTVAMTDPLAYETIKDLSFSTGYTVKPLIATPSGLKDALSKLYAKQETTTQGASGDITEEYDPALLEFIASSAATAAAKNEAQEEITQHAPIVRLGNMLMTQAVRLKASDIHLEPRQNDTLVRYRVDGLLRKAMQLPKAVHGPLISRLKIISNLDIAERRVPQDGAVRVKIEQREIDLRVSTMPTLFGEKIVMRIADQTKTVRRLDALGLSPKDHQTIKSFTERRKGIILVTGPTGSGKTTTLYALIKAIQSVSLNVLTIEDPVETKIEGINQTQINPDAGLTFASALRSILRQDPDAILVGEIRDLETAEIAVRAAMTGHLVLSTLHTNDAPSTITRLIDIGIPRYLVASLIEGVIAQRLVRMICAHCKEKRAPSAAALATLKISPESVANVTFYAGKGCVHCAGTGYAGRMAIVEVLDPSARLREMIGASATEQNLRLAALAAGMTSLGEDGLIKAKAGITTLEELLRAMDVTSKIESLCPGCARIVQYDFVACPFCEKSLSRACVACQRPLQLEWKVCPYCGTRPQTSEKGHGQIVGEGQPDPRRT